MAIGSERIPEELMYPQKKYQFMAWLQAETLPAAHKVQLFRWWAQWVGIYINSREMRAVERTGAD